MPVPRERWRKIPGLPGYQASDRGRVRSVTRRLSDGRRAGGMMLARRPDADGYPSVTIRGRRRRVHQLVAAAWLGPRPDGCEVRHLDSDRANAAAGNLAYGTRQDNERDKARGRTRGEGPGGEGKRTYGMEQVPVSRPLPVVSPVARAADVTNGTVW